MSDDLAGMLASHGIAPSFIGMDGKEHRVPEATLRALAGIFHIDAPRATPPPGIAEALQVERPPRCHVPPALRQARVWGLTCQVASLASARNLGMGDFADLATLCRIAAAAGADFVGVNPLHALFWSDPTRVSPFFPSNRRFLNPAYIALEWIEGFSGLSADAAAEAGRLRDGGLVDVAAVAALKERLLSRLFEAYPWSDKNRREFDAFQVEGGDALRAHALFETLSEAMVADGHGAGWMGWPEPLQDRGGAAVRAFAAANRGRVSYHAWLQWIADSQLARIQREAGTAGMRIGLYLDCAVGTAPDGSASWTDPGLSLAGAAIGAPPDDIFSGGQDWGLAPLSPVMMMRQKARPFAETLAAVMRHAGMMRLDHAMGIARLWLVPRGAHATEGAYVAYPLDTMLSALADASQESRAMVVGEDLGIVPAGFRDLMAARRIHSCRAFLLQQGATDFTDTAHWPQDALAVVATHDMPTFAGWWLGRDIDLGRDLGLLPGAGHAAAHAARMADRRRLAAIVGGDDDPLAVSLGLHAALAGSNCRLLALQMEDALALPDQVNAPGTTDQYPNWRRRLPVDVAALSANPAFRAHVEAIASIRPR